MKSPLRSDCSNCFGLCCVALPYAKSADFPFNKEAGKPCRNLCSNHLCSIHSELREKGFRGCVSYECFGAGQHVSQNLYKGKDWRTDEENAQEMFAVFPLVQQLHEMLWYLRQAMAFKETDVLHPALEKMYEETVERTVQTPKEILEMDMVEHRSKVNVLLIETSRLYRADFLKKGKKKRMKKGLDYLGANLTRQTLQGEDFRGTLLIAANLSHSDLRKADFIGADLRDSELSGANLSDALFLTQAQINSAKGNIHTKIPSYLDRPSHWLN